MKFSLFIILFLATASVFPNHAKCLEREEIATPLEIANFIPKDKHLIFLKKADLNKDNLLDYMVVLEKNVLEEETFESDTPVNPRNFMIIIKIKDGNFRIAKQNDKIIFCAECGGIFGDPFSDISLTKNGFIASMYGGSNWRWSYDYEFSYSRIDKTWQLVNVSGTSFHTSNPEDAEVTNYKPPKDFGKIDLADFDPDNFLYKDAEKKDK